MRPLILAAVGFAALSSGGAALSQSHTRMRDGDTILVLHPLRAHTLADDDPHGDLHAHRGGYLDHDIRDDDPRADLRARHSDRRYTADDLRRDRRAALRDRPQTVTPEDEAAAAVETEPVAPSDAD